MEQNNKLAAMQQNLQVAESDKVTNVNGLPQVLPTYSTDGIPVTVSFHQQRMKPIFDKGTVYYEGKKKKRKRGAIIDHVKDERRKDLKYICSNAGELRVKIGEALNEFLDCFIGVRSNPFLKSVAVQVTFKLGEFVLSTSMLDEGGIKIQKCFYKGEFRENLFSAKFCRPLFKQLQKVEQLAKGRPVTVSDSILQAIGLQPVNTETKKEGK